MKWPTRYEAKPSAVVTRRPDGTTETNPPLTRKQVGQLNARAAKKAAQERARQIREWDRSHGRLRNPRRSLPGLGQQRPGAGVTTSPVTTPAGTD